MSFESCFGQSDSQPANLTVACNSAAITAPASGTVASERLERFARQQPAAVLGVVAFWLNSAEPAGSARVDV